MPDLVENIYINQGKFYAERNELQKAETAYINAKQPEQAVQVYCNAGDYNEALRVAQNHGQTHMIPQINEMAARGGGGSDTLNDILNQAKNYEHQRNYTQAIDRLLAVQEHHS